ncbi:MAG: hypothetical protein NTW51_14435 [Cyanobacteria bacterium]|nr:hypothetical protein [Cyanobacteriota bacterium]
MQQGDVALREGAGTLYRPAFGAMRKEMPWPLTAGVLLALLLQLPRQLTVVATLQASHGHRAKASPNPLVPVSQLLGMVERSD